MLILTVRCLLEQVLIFFALETCKTKNKWCAERGENLPGFACSQLIPSSRGTGQSHAGRHPWALVAWASPTDLLHSHLSQGVGDWMAEHLLLALRQSWPRRWGGQGQPGRMQEDWAAPFKARQEDQAPSSSTHPNPTYIHWHQPCSGTPAPPAPATGELGLLVLKGLSSAPQRSGSNLLPRSKPPLWWAWQSLRQRKGHRHHHLLPSEPQFQPSSSPC